MSSIRKIEKLLKKKEIAIIGASRDRKKFGNIVMRFLEKRGFEVYPVNPREEEIEGIKCYRSVQELPEYVKTAVFITKPCITEKIILEIISLKHIGDIWLQQGAESITAIEKAEDAGLNTIHGECIMMYIKSAGFPHNVHRFLNKTFGKYPKD